MAREHKHTNWTGRKCPVCNGNGSAPSDSCYPCGGTGEEHGEVPAEECGNADCPQREVR